MNIEPRAQPLKTFTTDALPVRLYATQTDLARDVAGLAHGCLVNVLASQGSAAVILATGNSQIQFLEALIALGGIDWSKITLFHMDEYLGISADHPASFRRYMRERVESRVRPRVFHYLAGDALLPLDECDRYAKLLGAQPIDLCCLGIGENGHLAFNDPPVADFHDAALVKLVALDAACRRQQVNDGCFPALEAVPAHALTLTIPALMSAREISCVVPGERKAAAVRDTVLGPIRTDCPASILRTHPRAVLHLDEAAASLLPK